MARRKQMQNESRPGELTFAEIAASVEEAFGVGSVALASGASGNATDEARSAFVRTALRLVVIQRLEGHCASPDDTWELRRKAMREVREELASSLGVDTNEVFRLHHHAEGLKAKNREYGELIRGNEWSLAKKYGLGA